jgi:hypothetical protein
MLLGVSKAKAAGNAARVGAGGDKAAADQAAAVPMCDESEGVVVGCSGSAAVESARYRFVDTDCHLAAVGIHKASPTARSSASVRKDADHVGRSFGR